MKLRNLVHTLPLVVLLIAPLGRSLLAQDKELKALNEALATWQEVNQHVQIKNFNYSRSSDSVRFMKGTLTIFGNDTNIEVEFTDNKKKRLARLLIEFPPAAMLTTAHFRSIIGQDFDKVMPPGVGAGISIKKFEVAFEDRRKNEVEGATVALQFGAWAPFEGSESLTLTDFEGMFSVKGINKGKRDLEVSLSSYLLIPEQLSQQLGIGQTKLKSSGYINTKTQTFSIGADLTSREIPILTDRSLVLKNARVELAVISGRPKFLLNGQMQLQNGGNPIMPPLNGQVSVDVTGRLYGEGWMSQNQEWVNPFNLSSNVSITRMGLGFGVNFMTTPIPTPILAMEGGLNVKDRPGGNIRFSGNATIGVDLGNPTSNMLDIEVQQAYLSDVIAAFSPSGLPQGLSKELQKISFSNLHITITPPGPGVKLFGIDYRPGFYAEGAFAYGNIRGAMLIDINEEGAEAFAGLSPIIYPGFELTGTEAGQGPSLYLALKLPSTTALAINGNIKVLDVSAQADVYLSDAGFNVELNGKIFNTFSAGIDIAGKDLIGGDGLYVKASMKDQDNLVQKISLEASQEINRLAKELKASYDNATAQIESLRPQLDQSKIELTQKQNVIRARWETWCNLLNQRAAQDQERIQKEAAIRNLKAEILALETQLANERFQPATNLNPTNCTANSKPFQDYCYAPAQDYQWDILQPVNGSKATFLPESRQTAAAIVQGAFNVFNGCPSPQFGDAISGKCYSCPPGYQKDGLSTSCVKITPIQYQAAVRGQYIGCGTNGSFSDLTTAKCWLCPQGYERKATFEAITSNKACELTNLTQRESFINQKKIELVALEASLTLITNGIGELATQLTGVSTDVCNLIKDTDAINADPEVAPSFTKWAGLSLQVTEFQDIVKTVSTVQVGALHAAAWVVENGGNALGIVDIDEASFEGCLSTVSGGSVALKVKGAFAGNPLDASLKIDLKSPEVGIRNFAQLLLGNPNPATTYSNGTCTRPVIPRPQIGSSKIQDLIKFVNEGTQPSLSPRPKRETPPDWAAEKRF